MGLTTRDLHTMPLPRLMFMLNELADMNTIEDKDAATDATQDDIREFLM